MRDTLVRETALTTFDGTVRLTSRLQRPDRYGHLELPDRGAHRIARGGGYAYSAASFGEHSLVQDMTCFNRFLAFDAARAVLTLEPGVRLLELMQWAMARQLYFPVLPGYPLITVGGCTAADVHGKNPFRDGTFCDHVEQLVVFHPQHGYQVCSRDENPSLFAQTCGGFGLTGVITAVSLRLHPLPSQHLDVAHHGVGCAEDAVRQLLEDGSDMAYSWHDATPGAAFGRGIVHIGRWSHAAGAAAPLHFKPVDATARAKLPVSLWNAHTARCANLALLAQQRLRAGTTRLGVLQAAFPFASNVYFHQLFGRRGLREAQLLIPDESVMTFLQQLRALVNQLRAPTMMMSLKRFRGRQRSLSISGEGVLVAVDCYRNAATDDFFRQLDRLMLDVGGQPNLSKDSRLPGEIAARSLPGFAGFRDALFEYDAHRTMRSELSSRLGLS